MKSMLYVGATLMIGASIYGFVDYKNSSRKKEFNSMYTEEKKTEPVTVVVPVKQESPVEKAITKNEKKSTSHNKVSTKKDAIAVVNPIAEDEKMVTSKTSLPEKTTVTLTPAKESFVMKVVKKKRRLSSKLFSRAPLRDEIEMPVIEKTKKTDTKSSENKEQ